MIILSVETSCDETSVAITQDGKHVLSNVVLSQIKTHTLYGGVVPEIASREHVEGITLVFDEAIQQANIKKTDIDLVAVTQGPGLIGSLLVGINAAKAFAYAHDLPIIGVHHIVGHIYANAIENTLEFPLLALIISGGHTELIVMKNHMHFERLGKTQDDAIGEAYDKVARLLDLGYPGGPKLDEIAQTGEATIPMPTVALDGFDFSYSGLKSHVINRLHNDTQRKEKVNPKALAASFQKAAFDQIFTQTQKAIEHVHPKRLIVAGGVAANQYLRMHMNDVWDLPIDIPKLEYCMDNAAMIGIAAYYQWHANPKGWAFDFNGHARMDFLKEAYNKGEEVIR